MKDNVKKAKEIIEENIYMVISSASRKGKPWISPVFFAYDNYYNLFWVSNRNSRHSQLIQNNSAIAIVIFNSQAPEGQGDGVYFEAEAKELKLKEEIVRAMKILNSRTTKDEFKVKTITQVTGEGIWRIYKAIPLKTYTLSDGEYINGQYVDKRIEINLN